jgi:hypothetical protein
MKNGPRDGNKDDDEDVLSYSDNSRIEEPKK